MSVDKIIAFAEQVAKDDAAKMTKLEAWENFIKPLFKKHTGFEYRSEYSTMYSKEHQKYLDTKRREFENQYRNQ